MGIYVGIGGAALLLLGVVFVQGRREAALKGLGVILVALGFGAFHPEAPWTLLHKLSPVFRSQHVPSRFLYPAILVLGLVAAAGLGRVITRRADGPVARRGRRRAGARARRRHRPRRAEADAASDVDGAPDRIPQGRPFHFEAEPPFQYKVRDWAGPMYLAMLGNTGVINCYGAPRSIAKGRSP